MGLSCFHSWSYSSPCLHSELNRKAKMVKNYKAKIELLGSYDPQKQHIIKDPYYVSIQVNSLRSFKHSYDFVCVREDI